ncbi:uncharacterized protein PS065_020514 [Dugong dugon]
MEADFKGAPVPKWSTLLGLKRATRQATCPDALKPRSRPSPGGGLEKRADRVLGSTHARAAAGSSNWISARNGAHPCRTSSDLPLWKAGLGNAPDRARNWRRVSPTTRGGPPPGWCPGTSASRPHVRFLQAPRLVTRYPHGFRLKNRGRGAPRPSNSEIFIRAYAGVARCSKTSICWERRPTRRFGELRAAQAEWATLLAAATRPGDAPRAKPTSGSVSFPSSKTARDHQSPKSHRGKGHRAPADQQAILC